MNLVCILSDEHQRNFTGCDRNPHARTPNIDALAARGTRFSHAYTSSPLCVPARAALATGRLSNSPIPSKAPGFRRKLQVYN